jgi:hypothetical protein
MATKLVAVSFERYRAGAAHKRIHGGSTITRFYVFRPEDERNPANWATVEGYGPMPGNRKTHALAKGRAELIKRGIITE